MNNFFKKIRILYKTSLYDLGSLKKFQSYIYICEKDVTKSQSFWKRKLNYFEKPFEYLINSMNSNTFLVFSVKEKESIQQEIVMRT